MPAPHTNKLARSSGGAPEPRRANWLWRVWQDTGPVAAITVTLIGATSFLACLHLHRVAEASDADRFRLLHREVAEEVQARIDAQRHALLGLAGIFAADEGVTREGFRRAVQTMNPDENFPEVRGFGYIRRVAFREEEAFLSAVRDSGEADFGLQHLTLPTPAPDRLVVTYREPEEGDDRVLGLDVGTDARRRDVAERAEATGRMAISQPLTFLNKRDGEAGFLAMLPVKSSAGDSTLGAETGWVYAAILTQRLFADLGGGTKGEVAASLVAVDPGGDTVLLCGDMEDADPAAAFDPLRARTQLSEGGVRWTLATRTTPAFEHASFLGAWIVKTVGLIAAVLALALFRVPAIERRRGRREARQLAAEMTCKLREAAETDLLTGLLNRATILDTIQQTATGSRHRVGPHHAVLFIDFDRFKEVNDTRGHAAGDELLRRISGRIQAELRDTDATSSNPCQGTARGRRRQGDAVPARLGGDEFVVLLRNLARPEDAEAVAERLLERLSRPYQLSSGGPDVLSTPSIGIAIGRPGLENAAELLAAADAAMYEAKDAGRACIRVHNENTPALGESLLLAS